MFHLNDTNFKREPYRGYCPKHLKDLFTKPVFDIKGNGTIFPKMNMLLLGMNPIFIFGE
ncbi:hypothetical protein AC062_0001 [Pasteurellaceae bacterium NI1060]|nr:hypothetical protein AC062_0001 [Pasteurellaceae bacterium NI1060]